MEICVVVYRCGDIYIYSLIISPPTTLQSLSISLPRWVPIGTYAVIDGQDLLASEVIVKYIICWQNTCRWRLTVVLSRDYSPIIGEAVKLPKLLYNFSIFSTCSIMKTLIYIIFHNTHKYYPSFLAKHMLISRFEFISTHPSSKVNYSFTKLDM